MTNKEPKRTAGNILAGLSGGKKSGWSEDAAYRQNNCAWLRRSQRIALHVLDALEAKAMSQKALAEAIGVTPQYVSKLVKGAENLSLETIAKIEAALSITLLEVRDHAQSTSLKLQKAKTILRPTHGVVVYAAKLTYRSNSCVQGMAVMPERGSFYAATANC